MSDSWEAALTGTESSLLTHLTVRRWVVAIPIIREYATKACIYNQHVHNHGIEGAKAASVGSKVSNPGIDKAPGWSC